MVPTYQVTDSEEFDNETIKNLSPQQRRAWFRAQITDVKLRYNHRRCSCRHSTSSYMIDGSRQIYRSFSPSVPFRHSLEGLGSHFDQFPPESMSPRSGSLAISNSGTRTSEADTAVETQTIISSTRTSMLDTVQYPRHRSSPRPTSLANSRLQQEFPHRDSVDSIVTRDAPLTRASRRGIDRRSLGSFTHVAFQSSRTNLGNADTIG
ncbi:hypothetical protein P280DRAFT_506561 [Massarina eburnea CBS 473.64]|uniref:Uncharacterized protein n=1 Tax=Massarina eburnea CBS 473.64 TaxID=1395130 RepID=A0A6A6S5V7_9PLEO|nr:hypothetical protein P280DRAFT_506561 [Massarina eburnea CBS 473.64]